MDIEAFHHDHARYPDPEKWIEDLSESGLGDYSNSESGRLDQWGHAYIYRLPGEHGRFDVYSVGPDGIDHGGVEDDLSPWAGVNDGFHWKRVWPRGRYTLMATAFLSLGLLLLRLWFSWRFILPMSGIVLCTGAALGCYWLMHPGHVPDRNGPLALVVYGGLAGAIIFTIILVGAMRRHRHGW